MAKFSTALRSGMLNDTGLKALLDGGVLRVFSVASPEVAPANADAAETGTLLMELSAGGTGAGLTFDAPDGAVISKAVGEVWMTSSVDVSGRCAYFRFVLIADDGSEDDTAPRIQGTCGVVGADMVLTSLDVADGLPWTLNFFSVALPSA